MLAELGSSPERFNLPTTPAIVPATLVHAEPRARHVNEDGAKNLGTRVVPRKRRGGGGGGGSLPRSRRLKAEQASEKTLSTWSRHCCFGGAPRPQTRTDPGKKNPGAHTLDFATSEPKPEQTLKNPLSSKVGARRVEPQRRRPGPQGGGRSPEKNFTRHGPALHSVTCTRSHTITQHPTSYLSTPKSSGAQRPFQSTLASTLWAYGSKFWDPHKCNTRKNRCTL